MRGERRRAARERFERAVELPLLVLAVAMVPLLVIPAVADLSPEVERLVLALDWLVWGAFAMEYVVRLWLAEHRRRFVVEAWPDLLIVALPMLRPLRMVRSARVVRVLRLARLVGVLGAVHKGARRLFVRHRLQYVVLVALLLVVGASVLMVVVEREGDGSIDSFADALWWATTTVTTVGYGDTVPVTAAGRGIAVFLMLVGISLFGVLTAQVATFLLERDGTGGAAADDRLAEVLARLAAIEARLDGEQAAPLSLPSPDVPAS